LRFSGYGRYVRENNLACIHVVNANSCLWLARRNQTLVHCEGADRREHVSAVAAVIDERLVYPNLPEEIIDVGVLSAGSRYERYLARERRCTADTVDLAGIGTSVDRENYPIS
jgi:hypothetical protein